MSGDVQAALVSFATVVGEADEDSMDPVADLLRSVAAAIPGVIGVSLVGLRARKPHTMAFVGEVAARGDAIQFRSRQGPTLDALAGEPASTPNLSRDIRWPNLRGVAGFVRAVLSLPLRGAAPRRVALTLYASRPNFFDQTAPEALNLVLVNADLALAGLAHHSRSRHLQRALASNRRIGVAIGILMSLHQYGEDEAYAVMAAASQALNRRVSDIAEEIVMTGALPDRWATVSAGLTRDTVARPRG